MINKDRFKEWDGQTVWVCHTNWIKRVIKPTPVKLKWIITSSGGYAEFYILKRNGEASKSEISYYNKGRERAGEVTPLKVFDSKIKCKSFFIKRCNHEIDFYTNLKNKIKNETSRF